MPETDDLVHRPADRQPAGFAFAAENFRQSVAAVYPLQDAEGVADVALAAGVGAHQDRDRAEAQRLVREVLEVDQPNRRNHGIAL